MIDLYEEGNQSKLRYQMIVVNSLRKYRNKPFAAFIVPKARLVHVPISFRLSQFIRFRNLDWLYSTPAGRQQIIASAQYTTIVFIYLQSEQDYRDLEQVKAEMTAPVLDFKPAQVTDNIQVREEKGYYHLNDSCLYVDSILIFFGRHWRGSDPGTNAFVSDRRLSLW